MKLFKHDCLMLTFQVPEIQALAFGGYAFWRKEIKCSVDLLLFTFKILLPIK